MSNVPKSKRKKSKAQFLQNAFECRIAVLNTIKRFPKGWHPSIIHNLADLAGQAYLNAIGGNSVYLGKTTLPDDFDLRRHYFHLAESQLNELGAELSFAHDLVQRGNNFFKNKAESTKYFGMCTRLCYNARDGIRSLMKSDKKRWKEICAAQKKASDAQPAKD